MILKTRPRGRLEYMDWIDTSLRKMLRHIKSKEWLTIKRIKQSQACCIKNLKKYRKPNDFE
jgi:hypothetical protein